MEISGGQPSSTSHHTQATSSSVIVQSNQPEEGVSLTSLSDIHHLHHQHQHHHHHQHPHTPTATLAAASAALIASPGVTSAAATGIGSGSISSLAPHSGSHTKLHSLHQQSHLHAHHHQSSVHFGATRTPSAVQQQASSSSASSPILSPPGKTLGRNNNGTSKFKQ